MKENGRVYAMKKMSKFEMVGVVAYGTNTILVPFAMHIHIRE